MKTLRNVFLNYLHSFVNIVSCSNSRLALDFYRPQRSCEGYVFTACVCPQVPDQVHPPGPGTPLTPHWTRYTNPPPDQVHPPGRYTPWTRYTPQCRYVPLGRSPPRPGTPPRPGAPPWQVTPQTRYTPLG